MLDTTMKGRSCFFAAVFAAIVCMALPSFAADRTISSNYTLTADETVDGILTVESGVTVDLDGHNLTVQGLAGAGTITCNASILSELRMAIPQNAVSANSTVTISGNIRLVKDGPGLFVWSGGTLAADIPVTVSGGVFKLGVTTANVFGTGGTITVNGTGQFDINYSSDGGSSPVRKRTFYIEGDGPDGSGAIVNNATGNQWGYHLEHVYMTGDATIGGTSRIDFRGSSNYGIDAQEHELTIKNTGMIALAGDSTFIKNCTDIIIDGGVLQPCSPCVLGVSGHIILENGGIFANYTTGKNNATQQFSMPIIVREGSGVVRSDKNRYQMNRDVEVLEGSVMTVGNGTGSMSVLTNNLGATIAISGTSANLSVTGEFANNGVVRMTAGTFSLNAGSVATGSGVFELAGGTPSLLGDLSDFTGTIFLSGGTASLSSIASLGGTLVLANGTVSTSLSDVTCPVVFDLSEKTVPFTIPDSWLTLPAGKQVTIDLRGRILAWGEKLLSWETAPSLSFSLAEGSTPLVEKADGLYFGNGDIVPVSATWTGAAGNGLFADVANWACLDGNGDPVTAFPAASTTITLDEDVPQGGWATFDLAHQTGAIDLNGHRAVLQPPSGNSPALAITDTSADASHPGELHFTIGEGVAYTNTASFGITGNLSLVKDGPGLFVWSGGTLAADIPVTVSGGVFKLGVTTANVFGTGGTITVNGTGQFDINYSSDGGSSPVRKRTFYIEGDGPDGSGAIVNNATGNQWGYHLEHVYMTGDATIGGTSRIDFRGSSNYGIDAQEHELTIKNTGMIALAGDSTFIKNCTDIIIDGGVLQPCSPCVLGVSGHIILENGGIFANYTTGKNNATQQFSMPIIVREGSGVVRSDKNRYQMNRDVEVLEGSVMTVGNGTGSMSVLTNNLGATIAISGTSANLSVTGEFANNGVVRMTAGTFSLNAGSVATGSGVFELAGGTPSLLGDLSDFTGTIFLSGGTATISSINTFTGTLRLKDGTISSSLVGFNGTTVIDVAEQTAALDVDGKGWFTLASGKEVLVDVGDRELQYGDRLISWTTAPSNVRFRLLGEHKGALYKDEEGVVYAKRPGMVLIIR